MRVLFWNTHKNDNINSILCNIIVENNVNFISLAEYTADIDDLISKLSLRGLIMKKYASCCERINIIGNLESVELLFDNTYFTIQIINNIDILCCVHLNSKLYADHENRREIIIGQIIHEINRIESEFKTKNTVIVGDFNINPFDSSCIDARFFHGIPVHSEANRNARVIAGIEYNTFYNPMWNFLGDFKTPYGTYYYSGSETINTYWNIFDQVIIRPCLIERFTKDKLKIITETKGIPLLDSNGHPNIDISDHLPITFEIKENLQ